MSRPPLGEGQGRRLVLDTNVFVAAGFRPHSHSGQLLDMVRSGARILAWDIPTRRETRQVLERIPPLDWPAVAPLFAEGLQVEGARPDPAFALIPDPTDRKFAALALAAGAILISADRHLLSVRDDLPVEVQTAAEHLACGAG